jgi:hypothetical protein
MVHLSDGVTSADTERQFGSAGLQGLVDEGAVWPRQQLDARTARSVLLGCDAPLGRYAGAGVDRLEQDAHAATSGSLARGDVQVLIIVSHRFDRTHLATVVDAEAELAVCWKVTRRPVDD